MGKLVELFMRDDIPQKEFYLVDDVASLLNVRPHEIRFWETEFPQIRAHKSKAGRRIYRKEDVIIFFAIKNLLLEKKFTLAAARRALAQIEIGMKGDHEAAINEILPEISCAPIRKSENRTSFPMLDSDKVLSLASTLLKSDEEDKDFDDLTHQIYQQCKHDIATLDLQEALSPGVDMTADVVVERNSGRDKLALEPKFDYHQALIALMGHKQSLIDLLNTLDKYREFEFFGKLKIPGLK